MRHVILITALFLFCGHSAFARPQDSSDQDVRTILEKGLDAMGGEDVLRSINSVQMSLRGHEFTLDAFVREQSPKPVEYDDVEEILDFTGNRRRHQQTVRIAVESAKRTMTILTNRDAAAISFNLPDGSERKVPGRKIDLDEMREHLALSPLRVLFTASAASDLNRLPDMRLD